MNQKDIHKLKTIYTTILESTEDSGSPYILIDKDGNKFYYKDKDMTILHREDGPSVEYSNGYKEWYINGRLHRSDGPAIEYPNGGKDWYINGKLHREDGPAREWVNGDKAWWINGKLHREDGPAVEYVDRTKIWYLKGKRLTEKEFKAHFANKAYKASFKDTTDFEAFN
jgi:hypothetical protein